jgi:hypothetical protein
MNFGYSPCLSPVRFNFENEEYNEGINNKSRRSP